jgi:hypothetical protein
MTAGKLIQSNRRSGAIFKYLTRLENVEESLVSRPSLVLQIKRERRLVTPNIRQLEPDWRMAQAACSAQTSRLSPS